MAPADDRMTDLVSELAEEHLDRWLALGRRGRAGARRGAAALAADDEAIRRNIAERDPANVMGDRYFGAETTQRLVRALWGGDRGCPRPEALTPHAGPRASARPSRSPGVEAPYDTAHLTSATRRRPPQDDVERMSGMLAADPAGAPYPVVVLVPGVNVAAETYRWLAVATRRGRLRRASPTTGSATLFPGQYGLTPGVDLDAVTPEGYGTRPTTPGPRRDPRGAARADPPSVARGPARPRQGRPGRPLGRRHRRAAVGLARVVPDGPRGRRPTARTPWRPSSSATRPAPCCRRRSRPRCCSSAAPHDGVVAASAIRYGEAARRPRARPDRADLARGAAAHHRGLAGAARRTRATCCPAYPEDPTSARGFLEEPDRRRSSDERLRDVLAEVVTTFLAAHLRATPDAKAALDRLAGPPPDRARRPPAPLERDDRCSRTSGTASSSAPTCRSASPKKVKVLGQQLVLYRKPSDGSVVAMSDLCVHRGAALSGGERQGRLHRLPVPRLGVRAPTARCRRSRRTPTRASRARRASTPTRSSRSTCSSGSSWATCPRRSARRSRTGRPSTTPRPTAPSPATFLWKSNYERILENGVDIAHTPFVHARRRSATRRSPRCRSSRSRPRRGTARRR